MTQSIVRRGLPVALTVAALAALFFVAAPTSAQTSLLPFEQEVVNLVNQQRQAAGLAPLTVDARLVQAARDHNSRMLSSGQFAHQVAGELPLCALGSDNDRYDVVGYPWTACAENIAAGQSTPQTVVNAWLSSSGHRANILNPGYKHIGVGYVAGGPYGHYWTQDFGAASNTVPPSGATSTPSAAAPTATPTRTPVTPLPTATQTATAPAPTATRTATPTLAPGVDTVQITRATYFRWYRYLVVNAASTNGSATLKVYNTATGQSVGTLRNDGGGRYSGSFYTYSPPTHITVRSSAGGSAVSAVTTQ